MTEQELAVFGFACVSRFEQIAAILESEEFDGAKLGYIQRIVREALAEVEDESP